MKGLRLFFVTAFFVVVLDQGSKFLVKKYFSYTTNTGAAFGILQNQQWFLILVTFVVIGIVLYYARAYPLALGFLLGGAVGNLLDRLFLGHVVDFIDLGFWPSFNVADSFNTIGAGLLLLYFLKERS